MVILKVIDPLLSEISRTIRRVFDDYNYIEVFPPIINSGKLNGLKLLYNNNIYTVDPDITMRLLDMNKKYFINNPRIYYISGSVDEYLNETLKAGLELINSDEFSSNIEIIKTAMKALEELSVSDYNIDISLSYLYKKYIKNKKYSKIMEYIKKMDYNGIEKMDIDNKNEIINLMNTRTDKSNIEFLDKIVKTINDNRINIDFGTVRYFNYYDGLIFEIYNSNGFIAGGGNYKIKNMNACGFSFNVNNIYNAVKGNLTGGVKK